MTSQKSNTIRINLLCFSHVRYALGNESIQMDLPPGTTVAKLEKKVRTLGGSTIERVPLRVAVNKAFAQADTMLNDGDEVAFIPPVQGG